MQPIKEGDTVKHPTYGAKGMVHLQSTVLEISDDNSQALVSNPNEEKPEWLPVDELELIKSAPNSPFTLE